MLVLGRKKVVQLGGHGLGLQAALEVAAASTRRQEAQELPLLVIAAETEPQTLAVVVAVVQGQSAALVLALLVALAALEGRFPLLVLPQLMVAAAAVAVKLLVARLVAVEGRPEPVEAVPRHQQQRILVVGAAAPM